MRKFLLDMRKDFLRMSNFYLVQILGESNSLTIVTSKTILKWAIMCSFWVFFFSKWKSWICSVWLIRIYSSWWRPLEGVFRLRLQKTSSRRLQDVFIKTNVRWVHILCTIYSLYIKKNLEELKLFSYGARGQTV